MPTSGKRQDGGLRRKHDAPPSAGDGGAQGYRKWARRDSNARPLAPETPPPDDH